MPEPLSKEIRENIIHHHKNGAKNTEIVKWLRVSTASVERIIRLHREGKSIEVKAYKRGRKPAFCDGKMKQIEEKIREQPDITLDELVEQFGLNISISALCRKLIKKKLSFSGTLNGNLFMQYIWEYVVPTLKPYDILIMDCLSSHKMKIIAEMVESVGANVLYLPPYSPDFNAIETVISQIKADFRRDKPRSVEAICDSLTFAFYSVTPEQAENHFKNAILDITHQP